MTDDVEIELNRYADEASRLRLENKKLKKRVKELEKAIHPAKTKGEAGEVPSVAVHSPADSEKLLHWEGKTYIALPAESEIAPCHGCAFYGSNSKCPATPCFKVGRSDHTEIIWKEINHE